MLRNIFIPRSSLKSYLRSIKQLKRQISSRNYEGNEAVLLRDIQEINIENENAFKDDPIGSKPEAHRKILHDLSSSTLSTTVIDNSRIDKPNRIELLYPGDSMNSKLQEITSNAVTSLNKSKEKTSRNIGAVRRKTNTAKSHKPPEAQPKEGVSILTGNLTNKSTEHSDLNFKKLILKAPAHNLLLGASVELNDPEEQQMISKGTLKEAFNVLLKSNDTVLLPYLEAVDDICQNTTEEEAERDPTKMVRLKTFINVQH
jgi:hypothetical protein